MYKFLTILFIVFFVIPLSAEAQSACTSQIEGKSRAQLELELEACNKEIAEWTETLNKTKATSASFERDVAALTAQINAAQANIKARNIAISNLSKDISTKQKEIVTLDTRLARGKESLANIIRRTNDIHSYSLVEAVLSNKNISEFFVDLETYASTKRALALLFDELREVKNLTEAEKAALDRKREQEAAARAALENSKKQVEISQAEKKRLLTISQNQEKTYAQEVADRQAKAAQIRAVLFPLRDAGAIPFGTALQYAEAASAKTGVRAAFILAILQQESNLGANVGSCVIADLSSGATKGVNTGRIFSNGIHPTRDLPVLQTILQNLGRNPLETRVSCPIAGVAGYGGAMGPAQFIPSTWKLIESKLSSALNKSTPDPWNPSDAIMASAILLEGLIGSTGDSNVDERTAACRYYSGRTCFSNGRAGVGLSYGNQVMNRAATIQRDIDFLRNL